MLRDHATIGEVRKYLTGCLSLYYSERETNSLVRLIFAHLGHPSPGFMLDPNRQPGSGVVRQINEIVEQIPSCRPIQYILGHTWFDGLRIGVDERVLIPRPETEELVHLIGESTDPVPSAILDLGTGSGCIALALKYRFPGAAVTGLDISAEALDVARENGIRNQLEAEWIRVDLLEAIDELSGRHFDLIVSNPPYVRASEKKDMMRTVLDFEPPGALFVEDDDPLSFYRAISRIAVHHLSPGGTLWLEINEYLGKETSGLLKEQGIQNISVLKDIHGKERFIRAEK